MALLRLHQEVGGFRRVGQLWFDVQDPVPAREQQLVDKKLEERASVLVVDGGAKTGDQSVTVVAG